MLQYVVTAGTTVVDLEYYDKLLLAIAGSLALGAGIGLLTPVALSTGVAGGSILASVFVYDAMFRSPPVPRETVHRAMAAIVWHVFLAVTLVSALV